MKKSGNVHLGPYAGDGMSGTKCGKHGAPKSYIDDHRKTTGVPRIVGHQFKGGGSRKTGKTFK